MAIISLGLKFTKVRREVGSLHLAAHTEECFELVTPGAKGVEFEGLFFGGGEDFGGKFHVGGCETFAGIRLEVCFYITLGF
jgi:hypothetical protein